MLDRIRACLVLVVPLAVSAMIASPVAAQSAGGGKIVCWKDKSGKTIGCGDTVPPEYRDAGARELDSRGVTRRTIESTEEAAKRQERDKDLARQKEEERQRLAEQRRQDSVLLNTYANEKEIDQRRDRDLDQMNIQITQMEASLKNATDRHNDAKKRNAKDDIARTESELRKIEAAIATREKEREEIKRKYAEQKKRYAELKGGAPAPKK